MNTRNHLALAALPSAASVKLTPLFSHPVMPAQHQQPAPLSSLHRSCRTRTGSSTSLMYFTVVLHRHESCWFPLTKVPAALIYSPCPRMLDLDMRTATSSGVRLVMLLLRKPPHEFIPIRKESKYLEKPYLQPPRILTLLIQSIIELNMQSEQQ